MRDTEREQASGEPGFDARIQGFMSRYKTAWARPAGGTLADIWHQDAEMMHPELEVPLQGCDAVMAYLDEFMQIAPDLQVRPLLHAVTGDTVFIHFEATATIGGTKLVWEGVDRFDLDGDKARRGVGFFDTTAIRQALADIE